MPLTVRVCCAVFAGVVGAVDTPLGYEVINLGNGRPYQLKAFIQVEWEWEGASVSASVC